jgi:hypothetical protein
MSCSWQQSTRCKSALLHSNLKRNISFKFLPQTTKANGAKYNTKLLLSFVHYWRFGPTQAMVPSCLKFLDHTQWRNTVGRIPLDKWSASLSDIYLTVHKNNNRYTSMSPARFEPTTSAGERPQTHAFDCAAAGICGLLLQLFQFYVLTGRVFGFV